MKKVKIISDVSDLSGVHKAGDEPELEDARAAEYIANGDAEELAGPKGHEAKPKAPETHEETPRPNRPGH